MGKAKKAIFFDLDETIYPERDYRLSGFKVVARWLSDYKNIPTEDIFAKLCEIIDAKGLLYKTCFNELCQTYDIGINLIPRLVEIFRMHRPTIQPYSDFLQFMNSAKHNYHFGIISDGISKVQRRKMDSLRLNRWFKQSAIIITSELGSSVSKFDSEVFIKAGSIFGLKGNECFYIGDNPYKDFENPSRQGWITIRIKRGVYADINDNTYVKKVIENYNGLASVLKNM